MGPLLRDVRPWLAFHPGGAHLASSSPVCALAKALASWAGGGERTCLQPPTQFVLERWSFVIEESRGSQLFQGESWKLLPPWCGSPLPAHGAARGGWVGGTEPSRMVKTELPRRSAPPAPPTSVRAWPWRKDLALDQGSGVHFYCLFLPYLHF